MFLREPFWPRSQGRWVVRVEPPSWRPWLGVLSVGEDGGYRVVGQHGCYPVRVKVTGRGWRWVPAVAALGLRVRLYFPHEGEAVPAWLYWREEGRCTGE